MAFDSSLDRKGLSSIEVLVATTIVSVLLIGARELVATGQKGYVFASEQAHVRAEAQRALDACVSELRAAGPMVAPTAGAPRAQVSYDRVFGAGRKERVVLWTRVTQGRVLLERVVASPGERPATQPLADLGPAALPHGAPLGGVTFETVAPSVLRVKVSARALVEGRGQGTLVPIELESDVLLR